MARGFMTRPIDLPIQVSSVLAMPTTQPRPVPIRLVPTSQAIPNSCPARSDYPTPSTTSRAVRRPTPPRVRTCRLPAPARVFARRPVSTTRSAPDLLPLDLPAHVCSARPRSTTRAKPTHLVQLRLPAPTRQPYEPDSPSRPRHKTSQTDWPTHVTARSCLSDSPIPSDQAPATAHPTDRSLQRQSNACPTTLPVSTPVRSSPTTQARPSRPKSTSRARPIRSDHPCPSSSAPPATHPTIRTRPSLLLLTTRLAPCLDPAQLRLTGPVHLVATRATSDNPTHAAPLRIRLSTPSPPGVVPIRPTPSSHSNVSPDPTILPNPSPLRADTFRLSASSQSESLLLDYPTPPMSPKPCPTVRSCPELFRPLRLSTPLSRRNTTLRLLMSRQRSPARSDPVRSDYPTLPIPDRIPTTHACPLHDLPDYPKEQHHDQCFRPVP